MVTLNMGVSVTDQVFQKMEMGKSYTISARKIDERREDYQLTAGESLTFIEDIGLMARHCSMSEQSFYKHVCEMIKSARCPVIISCKNVPLSLIKRAELFEFMHVGYPINENSVLFVHADLIYALERSLISKKILEIISRQGKLSEITNLIKSELETCMNNKNEKEIMQIVEESKGNMDILLTKLYNYAILLESNKSEEMIKINEVDNFENLVEKLDLDSCLDFSTKSREIKETSDLMLKIKEMSKSFFDCLSLSQLNISEYPLALNVLNVFFFNNKKRKL